MKFGELARRADVGISAVRYCEREGLLPTPTPARLASGHRRHVPSAQSGHGQRSVSSLEIRVLPALSGRHRDDMADLQAADVEAVLVGRGAVEQCTFRNAFVEVIA